MEITHQEKSQLEVEAFEIYAGIDIDRAKRLCVKEGLSFEEEFWLPFQKYLTETVQ